MTIDQLPYRAPTRDGSIAHTEGGAAYKAPIGEVLDLAAPDITLYASVAELGQTSGSATIAAVWTAMGSNCGLIAASAQFAAGQTPADGTVDMYKDGAGAGWITLHAGGTDYTKLTTDPGGDWSTIPLPSLDFQTLETTPPWQTTGGTTPLTLNAGEVAYANITTLTPEGYTLISATVVDNEVSGASQLSWLTATVNKNYIFMRYNRPSGSQVVTNAKVLMVFARELTT